MLAIYKELSAFNYGGLTFKAVSACCVICMDLMSNPDSSFAMAMRAEVIETLDALESNKKASKLATNGANLVRFLLKKSAPAQDGVEAAPTSSKTHADLNKRTRTNSLLAASTSRPSGPSTEENLRPTARARAAVGATTAAAVTSTYVSPPSRPATFLAVADASTPQMQPYRSIPSLSAWSAASSYHSAPAAMLAAPSTPQAYEVPGYYTPPLHSNPALYSGTDYIDAGLPMADQFSYVSPSGSGAGALAPPLTPNEPDWSSQQTAYNNYDDGFQNFTGAPSPTGWQGSQSGGGWPPQ